MELNSPHRNNNWFFFSSILMPQLTYFSQVFLHIISFSISLVFLDKPWLFVTHNTSNGHYVFILTMFFSTHKEPN